METQEEKNKPNNIADINKGDNDEIEILIADYSKHDYCYKIIIVGNSGVGKTSISYRIKTGEFNAVSQPTLGFDYLSFYIKYKNKILKLEVWDTCGQEAYRSLIKSFFANSSLAIIVYAIDDLNSFNSIEEWVRQCKNECSPETKFFLIGNKADLDEDK